MGFVLHYPEFAVALRRVFQVQEMHYWMCPQTVSEMEPPLLDSHLMKVGRERRYLRMEKTLLASSYNIRSYEVGV
jgi:hypothetical protein